MTTARKPIASSHPDTAAEAVARSAVSVAAYFGALFGHLARIGDSAAAVFAGDQPVTAATLGDVVQSQAAATLAAHPVVGAGFVAAPNALADRELHLAWWQGEEHTPLTPRGVPIGHHVFDYSRHEWFRTPLTTGRPHVTGPYVDYVCTDEYVLTATIPVYAAGRLVGVAGADTTIERFEMLMRGPLGGGDVVVVNELDRCVVAADPLLRSGQRVDPTAYEVTRPVDDLPFRVLGSTDARHR